MTDHDNGRGGATLHFNDGTPDDSTWAFGCADAMAQDISPGAATSLPAAAPSQIVFIEGSVADNQILAEGVKPGVAVVILNPNKNGVQQIADYLQQHDSQKLAAISIVADGADGELQLGNTLLSASTIADYQQQLATIGAALAPGGDLLLYGCDVAQSSVGDAFLGDLAEATGVANIAAASHVVGAAAEGGSFDLDVDLGTAAIATGPFTAAAVAAYPDLLGIASNLVWYITESSTTSQTGVYTIDVNGSAAATSPTDIASTPSASFITLDGLAIDPSAGVYFVANVLPSGPFDDTNQILEGTISGGTPSVIYTSGNSGGDAVVGLAFDQLNGLLYLAVTDVNIGGSNTTTGIYTISALGSGTRTATDLVNLSSGTQAPTDIAIDTTNNLLFYTDGFPGLTSVEEIGVANLTTGAIINSDLVSYASNGDVEPYGIAVDSATDTLYWTTVNFSFSSGNAIYSAKYSTGASVTLSGTQTLATTSPAQAPIGIALDIPANGYYVDTATGTDPDSTANEVLFGGSLTSPETLVDVYNVPDQDGGTETLPTEAIVVEVQPVVTTSGTVTYVHGASGIAIDSGATVADADGYYLASGTVVISNYVAGDTLSSTNEDGITGSYSAGTLTLTGTASAANYQTVLDSVTFATTSTSTTPRTIDWTVSDGNVSSATTTSTVDVHVPPAVTAGATATFDGGGSPVTLDSGLTVSDASSSTLVSASVTLVSATSTDRLNFTTQNGISGSYNTSNGALMLTGIASVGNYQTALESITYSVSPTNSDPTDGGSDTSRTIDWSVNDGVLNSGTVTSTLDTVHVKPTVVAGATTTFDGGGSPVVLDSGLAVSDVDSGGVLSSATVTIASAISGDALNFSNTNSTTEGNIAVTSDNGGALVLTSSGSTATLAQWQTALEAVTYSFSLLDGDPTEGGTDTSRTIDWAVNDGSSSNGTSSTSTSTLDVVHEAPTVSVGTPPTPTFDGGGSPVLLDSVVTASDADSGGDLASAKVVIGGFIAGDTLTVGTAGGLTVAFSNGTLSLSGTASIATYNAALDSVKYGFAAGGDPTDGGSDTARTISWSVNDGVAVSNTGTASLDVVHVAPTITAGGTVTFVGGISSAAALDPGLTASDVDSVNVLSRATITVVGAIAGDTLNFTNSHPATEGNIAVASDSNGVLVLTSAGSTATLAQWETALESVTYSFSPSDGDPTGGGGDTSRTIDWVVSDGNTSNGTSNTSSSMLDTVHTPPAVSAGGTVGFVQGGSPVALNGGLVLTDPDSGGEITSATISVAGGVFSTDGDTLATNTTGTAITASYDEADETLTLTGTDTLTDYQAVLRLATFSSSGATAGSRVIDWTADDAASASVTSTSTVTVRDLPAITAGGTVTFDGGGAPVTLDGTLTVADASSATLASATVVISSGYLAGDTLTIGDTGGLSVGFNEGTLTLAGTASIATYNAALDSVDYVFSPTDGDPTDGGIDTSRTISWSVNDGVASSTAADSALDVVQRVYNYATASAASPNPVNFGEHHVGDVLSQALSITNLGTADGYTENLDASIGGATGSATASGSFSGLAAGLTNNSSLVVGLNTGLAGVQSGTATIALTSDGSGIDTRGTTALASQTIAAEGTLYNYATASTAAPNPVNFGIVHVGTSVSDLLTITNTGIADGFTENLDAGFVSTAGAITATGTVIGLAASVTSANELSIGLNTSAAGTIDGTAVLGLVSDGSGIDSLGTTILSAQTIAVTGTVDNYATAAIAEVSGEGTLTQSGNNYVLNLDTLSAASSPVAIDLAIDNTAIGLSDQLSGSFAEAASAPFINSGFAAFCGVGAGETATIAPAITLAPGTFGTFTETFTLAAVGSNASGYSGTLTPETLTVTGMVLPVIDMTTAPYDIINGAGNITIVATATDLQVSDEINGGGGINTLDLQGGGIFHLEMPSELENIQVINATEGTGTAEPFIYLRNGLDLTLNLEPAAIDPQSAGAVVHGATNSDIINLGEGEDTVYVGSGETINGGTGLDWFYITAATTGETISGDSSGTNDLYVQGGGTVAMGGSITNMNAVFLENAGTSYDFTANSTHGLVIHASTDSDTITVGDASQTVIGSSGSLVVIATAAEAGVDIRNGSGSKTLEITTGGSIALNSGLANITVELEAATTLALPTNSTVGIDGIAGDDVFVATNGVLRAGQSITGGGSNNTLVAQGGGVFNLAAPTTLSNIQVLDATEGQGSAEPFIFLRNGLDLTLNLGSASTDPQSAGAVVHGATNDDIINLGSGDDTVYVGSGEVVNGGSGEDLFDITNATTGETIAGDSSGTNNLYVQGGGTVAMGGSITNMNAVFLENAGTSYNFTANSTQGLVIHASADNDTITVGDASQSVLGSTGDLVVLATAAEAGVYIRSGSASNTLEITSGGSIALNSGLANITVELEAATTLALPTNSTVGIDGLAGDDVFVATNGVLRAGQSITGGGTSNTLVAQGGGVFNLAAPTMLSNIQVLDATEGEGGAEPFIFLRDGLDLTVNLGSAATDPQSAGAVVHGATNSDIINLGSGDDTVYVGSGETINGGTGLDRFYITAATTGETISGDSSGTNDLYVQGGGTVAMGGSITNMNAVFLENAGTSYNFTANSTQGLVIHASADSDTITVGDASQSVLGTTGDLDVLATAAEAGVYIRSGAGSNELDITTSGTGALYATDNNLTVQLDAANTTLTLDHMEFIHAEGTAGSDTIIAGAAGQVLTGGGANDTLEDAGKYGVTFQDTITGIEGDTLADFSSVDTIDITNLTGVTSAPIYTGNATSGTLAVIGSTGTVDIDMTNLKTGGVFSAVSDGHGGTLITYS